MLLKPTRALQVLLTARDGGGVEHGGRAQEPDSGPPRLGVNSLWGFTTHYPLPPPTQAQQPPQAAVFFFLFFLFLFLFLLKLLKLLPGPPIKNLPKSAIVYSADLQRGRTRTKRG